MSNFNVYEGQPQNGYGLGASLFSLIKKIGPKLVSMFTGKMAKRGAKFLGRKAAETGLTVLEDVALKKQNLGESLKARSQEALTDTAVKGINFARKSLVTGQTKKKRGGPKKRGRNTMRGRGRYSKQDFVGTIGSVQPRAKRRRLNTLF
jgi:hypothetical protein